MEKIHCRKVIEVAVTLTEPQTTEELHKQFLVAMVTAFHAPVRLYRSVKPTEDYFPIAILTGKETTPNQILLSDNAINNNVCGTATDCTALDSTTTAHTISCTGPVITEADKSFFSLSLPCRSGFHVHLIIETEFSAATKQHIETLFTLYVNQLGLLWHGMVDNLTGLMNRQSYQEKMAVLERQYQLSRKRRASDINDSSFGAFAIIDIDHFKQVNDHYGHFCGDEVLAKMAEMMRHFFRENDLLFRYGGEEFVVILLKVDMREAEAILNRFLTALEQKTFSEAGRVTVSAGFSELNFDLSQAEILRRADQALYFSKTHGRNRVTGFTDMVLKDSTHRHYAYSA